MGAALRACEAWHGWAIRSRIPALVAFARNLKAKLLGILGHCRFPLHTGLLEGINNKIKVLKRMAYGFRNDTYFFLRSAQHFPEIPEEPKKTRYRPLRKRSEVEMRRINRSWPRS